jgi:hypothetical protein
MRVNHVLLLVFIADLLAPQYGSAQSSPADHSGRVPAAAFPNGKDLADYFTRKAKGKDVWNRWEITGPETLAHFDRIARELGVANGQITRAQYLLYLEQRAAKHSSDRRPSPFRPPFPNGDVERKSSAESSEYRPTYQFQTQPHSAKRSGSRGGSALLANSSAAVEPAGSEEVSRNRIVYRAGKLPKGLPSWFAELDADKDGQIGLYEWKASGQSIAEFEKMDRNNDGFLTIAEVLHYCAQQQNNRPSPQVEAVSVAGTALLVDGSASNNAICFRRRCVVSASPFAFGGYLPVV